MGNREESQGSLQTSWLGHLEDDVPSTKVGEDEISKTGFGGKDREFSFGHGRPSLDIQSKMSGR